MGLKSPYLFPLLLLTAAASFYLKDAIGPSISEPSAAPPTGVSPSVPPKRSAPQDLIEIDKCLRQSTKIYNDEVSEFEALERKLGYFRFRNDRYGKGYNTIIEEKFARDAEC